MNLPESVAWRQKEQFSDGVGYNWIDSLKELVESSVTDAQMEQVTHRFPAQPPRTKEEYYYRSIFEDHFPSRAAALTVPSVPSIACSTPTALAWDASFQNMNEPFWTCHRKRTYGCLRVIFTQIVLIT
jgi:asparagine synthase (glutamine-hydrolysing)